MRNAIRKLRVSRNLTQKDVAKAIKVTQNTVSMWERGLSQPTYDQWEKLAEFFKKSISEVRGEKRRLYLIEDLEYETMVGLALGGLDDAMKLARELVDKVTGPEAIKIVEYESDTNTFTEDNQMNSYLLDDLIDGLEGKSSLDTTVKQWQDLIRKM